MLVISVRSRSCHHSHGPVTDTGVCVCMKPWPMKCKASLPGGGFWEKVSFFDKSSSPVRTTSSCLWIQSQGAQTSQQEQPPWGHAEGARAQACTAAPGALMTPLSLCAPSLGPWQCGNLSSGFALSLERGGLGVCGRGVVKELGKPSTYLATAVTLGEWVSCRANAQMSLFNERGSGQPSQPC